MNQAEVAHAAWANRNETGLSLQQAAEFDTKDSLILEVELKNYEHSANSNGRGPSLVKLGKKSSIENERQLKGVAKTFWILVYRNQAIL